MILIKVFLFVFALFCTGSSATLGERHLLRRGFHSGYKYVKNFETKFADLCSRFEYATQNVEHFGFNNVDTYQQRYILSDKYWKGTGSPIFFYTGNEGDIQWFCENTGFIWEIAEQFGAMVVFAEHRYYGTSMPYGKKAYDKKNLDYLTSEQALADYAYLITSIKSTKKGASESPVIAFGGSYGGMLSAWFRMKYSNIVAGALAASAPIFQMVTECDGFNAVVTDGFKKADPLCPHIIRNSWDIINEMSKTTDGLQILTETFKLCSPLKNASDLKDFLNDIYGNVAMVNYPYSAGFLAQLPAWPVNVMCSKMIDKIDKNFKQDSTKMIKAIYEGINVYTNYTGKLDCNNLDVDGQNSGFDMDSWNYQVCTEFVFPMCSNGKTDMFEVQAWDNITYNQDCMTNYKVSPKWEWPVINYGGSLDDLKYHSNIIFSNGDLDPWSSGGVLETINEKLPAIIIKNGAHHLDLRSANAKDPESVIEARKLEIKYIQQWIDEYRFEL